MRFKLNTIGYNYIEPTTSKIIRPSGSSDYLFLFFITEVTIHLHNIWLQVPPYSCLIYTTTCPQCYYNETSGFTNDWFHFTGDEIEAYLTHLSLPLNQPFSLTNYSFIRPFIKSLEEEYLCQEPFWEEHIDSLITHFFICLSREHMHYTAYRTDPLKTDLLERFRTARLEILTHVEYVWTIDSMAVLTNLSKSRFSVLYKSFFGIAPKDELIHERVKKAQYLLSTHTLTVSEVAYRVGYENIYHFSRQFKKITGISPGKW